MSNILRHGEMRTKPTFSFHPIPFRMAVTMETANAGKGVAKEEPSATAGRNATWCSTMDSYSNSARIENQNCHVSYSLPGSILEGT